MRHAVHIFILSFILHHHILNLSLKRLQNFLNTILHLLAASFIVIITEFVFSFFLCLVNSFLLTTLFNIEMSERILLIFREICALDEFSIVSWISLQVFWLCFSLSIT